MRRLYPEVAMTKKFEDLLNDRDLDAVVIATPVRFHYTMAKADLSVGKHVFIEKPIARTEAEASELVSLAERQGLVLMVGHTFLFSPAVRRMKEIINAGDIGEVQYIAARRLNLGLFQKTSMWLGTWRRMTFPFCCICWMNCHRVYPARAAVT